ncbi:Histone-lysine N-methyltransferase SETMAR [Anthophora retusa]
MDRVLTCDEKWILYCNNKRTNHWLPPKDSVPPTAKTPLHTQKILICVWWTAVGIVHYEFLNTGQTITGWEILPHPPYSPDISPSDYHLFLALDNHMRNRRVSNKVEIGAEVGRFFNSKDTTFYKSGIYKLVSRWKRIVDCEGDYFNE